MPGLSGLDVLRAMHTTSADLPMVRTSGHIAKDTRAEALAAGAYALLRKENLQDELAALVPAQLDELREQFGAHW